VVSGAYNMPSNAVDSYQKAKNSVESAANAYSSKFEASRSKGRGAFVAGISALGGMAWEAYREGRSQTARATNANLSHSQSIWRNMVSAPAPETPPIGRPLTQNQPQDTDSGNP